MKHTSCQHAANLAGFPAFTKSVCCDIQVLSKHCLSAKWQKTWRCFPSILLLPQHLQALENWNHALSVCLQTHHCNLFYLKHGCKYSLFTTYTKPDFELLPWLPISSWGLKNLKLLVLIFCNHLSSPAHIVEWVQSFRLHWGKWIIQN